MHNHEIPSNISTHTYNVNNVTSAAPILLLRLFLSENYLNRSSGAGDFVKLNYFCILVKLLTDNRIQICKVPFRILNLY